MNKRWTFGRILAIAAKCIANSFALLFLVITAYEAFTHTGSFSPTPPVSSPISPSEGAFLFLWLGCVVYTCWGAFNREMEEK